MTNQVAETIREQIGHKALYMIGAKNLLAHAATDEHRGALSLRMRGSKVANYMKVTLDHDDTYTIEYGKVWGTKYTVKNTETGMYFDMLRDSIERNTGLYTKLF